MVVPKVVPGQLKRHAVKGQIVIHQVNRLLEGIIKAIVLQLQHRRNALVAENPVQQIVLCLKVVVKRLAVHPAFPAYIHHIDLVEPLLFQQPFQAGGKALFCFDRLSHNRPLLFVVPTSLCPPAFAFTPFWGLVNRPLTSILIF